MVLEERALCAVLCLVCVSLRRRGDAPIPAAPVSSPLPFDQRSRRFTDTHALHTEA